MYFSPTYKDKVNERKSFRNISQKIQIKLDKKKIISVVHETSSSQILQNHQPSFPPSSKIENFKTKKKRKKRK